MKSWRNTQDSKETEREPLTTQAGSAIARSSCPRRASRGRRQGGKNWLTNDDRGAVILVVKLKRTDTTLDLSLQFKSKQRNTQMLRGDLPKGQSGKRLPRHSSTFYMDRRAVHGPGLTWGQATKRLHSIYAEIAGWPRPRSDRRAVRLRISPALLPPNKPRTRSQVARARPGGAPRNTPQRGASGRERRLVHHRRATVRRHRKPHAHALHPRNIGICAFTAGTRPPEYPRSHRSSIRSGSPPYFWPCACGRRRQRASERPRHEAGAETTVALARPTYQHAGNRYRRLPGQHTPGAKRCSAQPHSYVTARRGLEEETSIAPTSSFFIRSRPARFWPDVTSTHADSLGLPPPSPPRTSHIASFLTGT